MLLDRHDPAGAEDEAHLLHLDLTDLAAAAHLHDDQQTVAVELGLGTLRNVHDVGQRQGVDVEALADLLEHRRVAEAVDVDPYDALRIPEQRGHLGGIPRVPLFDGPGPVHHPVQLRRGRVPSDRELPGPRAHGRGAPPPAMRDPEKAQRLAARSSAPVRRRSRLRPRDALHARAPQRHPACAPA